MGAFLAVANRKGGVGKSTISVILPHAFAVWGGKRVLLIDLDAQSNSSLTITGSTKWIEAQKSSGNIAAYIEDRMYEQKPAGDYGLHTVGDIEQRYWRPHRNRSVARFASIRRYARRADILLFAPQHTLLSGQVALRRTFPHSSALRCCVGRSHHT